MILKKLYNIGILSPKGFYLLLHSIFKHGANIFALLYFSARNHPKRLTLNNSLSYQEFVEKALIITYYLFTKRTITSKSSIAFLCKNSNESIISFFACARLGTNITFLNADMSNQQIENVIQEQNFDYIIVDDEFVDIITSDKTDKITISELSLILNTENYLKVNLKRQSSGYINVLTGGTSGKSKIAKRKPSIVQVLSPFFALLDKLDLDKHQSVYIGVPFYHGYGLASLIMSTVLGAKIFTDKKSKVDEVLKTIDKECIEVLIIVPTQLKRMLKSDKNKMKSVKKILSGGAPIHKTLIDKVSASLGEVLYNLYGTSETGFCALATPKDLQIYPETIGKIFRGVQLKLISNSKEVTMGEVGEVHIKTSWSIANKKYIGTGDLAYMNFDNFLFLKGRNDNMIVSGGENVYPIDVENVLLQHDDIYDATAIAVDDIEYGKRLIAFVVSDKLTSELINNWLKVRISRYQTPHKICILDKLPVNKVGKISKKQLEAYCKKEIK